MKVENTWRKNQSVQWSGAEIIDHFGILKKDGNHYLSDDLMPDHAFSNLVLDEMLEGFNHDQKKDEASGMGVLRMEVWFWQSIHNT